MAGGRRCAGTEGRHTPQELWERKVVCPVCEVQWGEDTLNMVGCDGCDFWVHMACDSAAASLAAAGGEEAEYFCPNCRARSGRREPERLPAGPAGRGHGGRTATGRPIGRPPKSRTSTGRPVGRPPKAGRPPPPTQGAASGEPHLHTRRH